MARTKQVSYRSSEPHKLKIATHIPLCPTIKKLKRVKTLLPTYRKVHINNTKTFSSNSDKVQRVKSSVGLRELSVQLYDIRKLHVRSLICPRCAKRHASVRKASECLGTHGYTRCAKCFDLYKKNRTVSIIDYHKQIHYDPVCSRSVKCPFCHISPKSSHTKEFRKHLIYIHCDVGVCREPLMNDVAGPQTFNKVTHEVNQKDEASQSELFVNISNNQCGAGNIASEPETSAKSIESLRIRDLESEATLDSVPSDNENEKSDPEKFSADILKDGEASSHIDNAPLGQEVFIKVELDESIQAVVDYDLNDNREDERGAIGQYASDTNGPSRVKPFESRFRVNGCVQKQNDSRGEKGQNGLMCRNNSEYEIPHTSEQMALSTAVKTWLAGTADAEDECVESNASMESSIESSGDVSSFDQCQSLSSDGEPKVPDDSSELRVSSVPRDKRSPRNASLTAITQMYDWNRSHKVTSRSKKIQDNPTHSFADFTNASNNNIPVDLKGNTNLSDEKDPSSLAEVEKTVGTSAEKTGTGRLAKSVILGTSSATPSPARVRQLSPRKASLSAVTRIYDWSHHKLKKNSLKASRKITDDDLFETVKVSKSFFREQMRKRNTNSHEEPSTSPQKGKSMPLLKPISPIHTPEKVKKDEIVSSHDSPPILICCKPTALKAPLRVVLPGENNDPSMENVTPTTPNDSPSTLKSTQRQVGVVEMSTSADEIHVPSPGLHQEFEIDEEMELNPAAPSSLTFDFSSTASSGNHDSNPTSPSTSNNIISCQPSSSSSSINIVVFIHT